MSKAIYLIVICLIRIIMKKPEIVGAENIEETPAVFVSNHLGYYAPLKLVVFTGLRLAPWVTYEVTDRKICRQYLIREFLEPDLKLKPPLSNLLAALVSPLCVTVMRQMDAVPVYHKSRRIYETFNRSVSLINQGRNLLIFPEIALRDRNTLGTFNNGFVHLAQVYYEQCHKLVDFYPVCVGKKTNRISFGKKVIFDPQKPFFEERNRIVKELTDSIKSSL